LVAVERRASQLAGKDRQQLVPDRQFQEHVVRSKLGASGNGGRYLNSSLPQYEDVEPALKIVDEALTKAEKIKPRED
jgi:hypothetical protein